MWGAIQWAIWLLHSMGPSLKVLEVLCRNKRDQGCLGFWTSRKDWEECCSHGRWAGEHSAGLQAGACSHRLGLVTAPRCDLPRQRAMKAVGGTSLWDQRRSQYAKPLVLYLKQLCAPLCVGQRSHGEPG